MSPGEQEKDPTRRTPGRRPAGFFTGLRRRWRILGRMRRLYWMQAALRIAPSESQRLFALTALIGAVCGLAAVAFHVSIQVLERHLIERAMGASRGWIAWTIATPALGGLVCGIALQYLVPRARGSGIPEVKATFAQPGRHLRIRDSVGKFAVGAAQIGTGASLGREGPTVHICAGIAELLGSVARVSPANLRRLLPVGAAAGVAAAFNAPIAAVTFAVEEIVGDLDKTVLSGVIVAAALAAVIERSLLGVHPVFELPAHYGLEHSSSLMLYVLLGVAAAAVAVLFTDSLLMLRRWFGGRKWLPGWAKPAVGCGLTGVLAVLALQWFGARGITGGGYHTLEDALSARLATGAMLALCGLKLAATVFSYSSGGSGGIFAPALFIGGMLGGALGQLDVGLLGHDSSSIGSFALVGMGAVFAASIRAPITSVLIIIEMTDGYSLILPLMIANMIAYGLAHRLRPTPIYEALLEQDGVRLRRAPGLHVLEHIRLDQVVDLDASLVVFGEATRASELLGARTQQEVYPVVDRSGRLLGIITDEEFAALRAEPGLDSLVNAADLMRPPIAVQQRDDLRTALETMLALGLRRIPVVDEHMLFAGLLDEETIARAYLRGHVK